MQYNNIILCSAKSKMVNIFFLLFIIVAYTTTTFIRNLGEFSIGALFYTWYIFNTKQTSIHME